MELFDILRWNETNQLPINQSLNTINGFLIFYWNIKKK